MQLVVERGSSLLPGSDWHLDWVELVDLNRGHKYRWKCGAWFSGKEGLKKEWTAEKAAAGEQQPLTLIESPAGTHTRVAATRYTTVHLTLSSCAPLRRVIR